jgi:anti-sigma factor RsiW
MNTHEMIDERLERLMVRVLDAEASPAERADLEAQLAQNPRARAIFDEYAQIDQHAKAALQSVIAHPMPAIAFQPATAAPHIRRGRWLAAAAGVLAAAAAIGLFTSPAGRSLLNRGGPSMVSNGFSRMPAAHSDPRATLVSDEGLSEPQALRRLAPRRDVVSVQQDWIGVFDPKTEQVYLLGLDRRNTRTVPVRFEH